jgi:hypothetical protein
VQCGGEDEQSKEKDRFYNGLGDEDSANDDVSSMLNFEAHVCARKVHVSATPKCEIITVKKKQFIDSVMTCE